MNVIAQDKAKILKNQVKLKYKINNTSGIYYNVKNHKDGRERKFGKLCPQLLL